jgi:hypothetical protein
MSTNRYRAQIDACRPGTGDLSLPALADLARAAETDKAVADELTRSERFDRAVSTAMHDVPLPAGLLERLEAKLAAADVTDVESTGEVALPPRHRFSRRFVLTSAGLATAAALLLAVVSQMWSPAPRRVTREQLTAEVSLWIGENAPNGAAWKKPSRPVPSVLAVPVTSLQERTFVTARREPAVVFDLTPAGGQQVLLFVVSTQHEYDVQTSPFVTRLTGVSGGMAVAAWQKDGTLYVLAVREGDQHLEDYIRKQPLAMVGPRALHARPA